MILSSFERTKDTIMRVPELAKTISEGERIDLRRVMEKQKEKDRER